MALYNDVRKLMPTIRTPGSALSPKPGVNDAGGNQPAPVLSQPEQQATSTAITPRTQTPTAPAADMSNVVPGYQQQQLAQQTEQLNKPQTGFLTPEQATAGQYSGYTSTGSSAANADILKRIPQGPATAWTPEQWKQAYQESQGNPFLAGTVSAQGIQKLYNDYVTKGQVPDANAIGQWMGGMYLPDFKPNPMTVSGQGQTWKPASSEEKAPDWVQQAMGKTPSITPKADLASGAGNKLTEGKLSTGGLTPGNASANLMAPTPVPPSVSQPADNKPAEQGGLGKVFNYFKTELEKERDKSLSNSDVEAASRGVFYGTPGTQAREDVRDKFGRSLAQFESDLLQKEQENELSRLGLATNLFGTIQQGELGRLGLASQLIPSDMEAQGIDPNLYAAIAQMFGGKQAAGGNKPTVPAAVPDVSKPPLAETKSTITPKAAKQLKRLKR